MSYQPPTFAPQIVGALAAPPPSDSARWDLTALSGVNLQDWRLATGGDYLLLMGGETFWKYGGNNQIACGPFASPSGSSPTVVTDNSNLDVFTYTDATSPSRDGGNGRVRSRTFQAPADGATGWGVRFVLPASRALRRVGVALAPSGSDFRARFALSDASSTATELALPAGNGGSLIADYIAAHPSQTLTVEVYSTTGQGSINVAGAYLAVPVYPPRPRGAVSMQMLLGQHGHGRGSLW